MRLPILAAATVWTLAAYAQDAPKATITPDEIMEKSIQATGGREALMKMTSLVATGTMDIVSMGTKAATEAYAKAPDKRMTVTKVEGYGEVKEGFDGKTAWSMRPGSGPDSGPVELSGAALAAARRDAQFNGELRWKELYPKAEVTGKEKVGDRDCWVLKLTPAEGTPVVRYYDAETFLMAKAVVTTDTPQGPADIPVEFSDWRDIGNGVKGPYTMKVTLPGIGELITKYTDVKYNVEIDDARFAKPQPETPPPPPQPQK
ncbi:MAG: hypothetical protein ACLQBJ_04565 [Bryobacteraceae bacterium]